MLAIGKIFVPKILKNRYFRGYETWPAVNCKSLACAGGGRLVGRARPGPADRLPAPQRALAHAVDVRSGSWAAAPLI